jgi:hypothetical protein
MTAVLGGLKRVVIFFQTKEKCFQRSHLNKIVTYSAGTYLYSKETSLSSFTIFFMVVLSSFILSEHFILHSQVSKTNLDLLQLNQISGCGVTKNHML